MPESRTVTAEIPASPEAIFDAWMSSEGHASMTGAGAKVDPRVGGRFSAWDEYISGTTLELDRPRRLVQAWRTSEFPEDAPDSRVEVRLEKTDDATRVTITHTDIPDGQGDAYEAGWQEYYFLPMNDWFDDIFEEEESPLR